MRLNYVNESTYFVAPDHDDNVEFGSRGSLSAKDGEGRGGPARGGGQRPAAARLVGIGHVVVGADLGVGHHARVWERIQHRSCFHVEIGVQGLANFVLVN